MAPRLVVRGGDGRRQLRLGEPRRPKPDQLIGSAAATLRFPLTQISEEAPRASETCRRLANHHTYKKCRRIFVTPELQMHCGWPGRRPVQDVVSAPQVGEHLECRVRAAPCVIERPQARRARSFRGSRQRDRGFTGCAHKVDVLDCRRFERCMDACCRKGLRPSVESVTFTHERLELRVELDELLVV